jgi:DNA-binding transcriptional ArsR family regulator
MMDSDGPPILPGCTVLPPMDRPPSTNGRSAPGHQGKAKGETTDRKTGDRFAVLNAFVDAGMAGLSKVEALTWLVLYRDTRNGTSCVSAESIATRIGCSRRAVTNALAKLRKVGLLIQVFRGGEDRGPSRYRVLPLPKPPKTYGSPLP